MPYDNACKFLADQYPATFASWILDEEITEAKTLKTELKLEPVRADSVSLLRAGNRLLHLEFQVDVEEEPPLGLRMVDYYVQLYRKYRLPVKQCAKIDTIKVVPKRRSLATTAYVLAGLRFTEEQLDMFFKEEIMKESVTYQKILKKGLVEGEARGEALGKAKDILKILTIRGFQVPKAIERRVLACQDLAILDGWLTRAVTSAALGDVFP